MIHHRLTDISELLAGQETTHVALKARVSGREEKVTSLCLDDALHELGPLTNVRLGQKFSNNGLKDDSASFSELFASRLVLLLGSETTNVGLNKSGCFQLDSLRLTGFFEPLSGQETTHVALNVS